MPLHSSTSLSFICLVSVTIDHGCSIAVTGAEKWDLRVEITYTHGAFALTFSTDTPGNVRKMDDKMGKISYDAFRHLNIFRLN